MPDVWEAVIRSRALVLDEMASRRRIAAGRATPEIARAADSLIAARSLLSDLSVRGGGDRARRDAQIADARRARARCERALAERSASFARDQSRAAAGYREVARAIPSSGALIAYTLHADVLGEGAHRVMGTTQRYVALVRGAGDAPPRAIALGGRARIDSLVHAWHTELARGEVRAAHLARAREQSYRRAASALRAAILDPVLAAVGPARQVFVVPDGALQAVSLDALTARDGRYVVETGPVVTYMTSERDLLAPDTRGEPASLLAVGGADYEDAAALVAPGTSAHVARGAVTGGCEAARTLRFAPLPATIGEVRAIARLWGSAAHAAAETTLTAGRATESAVKALAGHASCVHLATHGFFLQDDCRGAAGSASNSYLLSGLAFAGANERAHAPADADDGILTAEEILGLDLSATRCAVVTACDAAQGETVRGEGVVGLRRAFAIAGARTLVMPLWSVDDVDAGAWAERFYRAWRIDGLDVAHAAHAATRDALARRRARGLSTHPYRWAAFVVSGADTRPE